MKTTTARDSDGRHRRTETRRIIDVHWTGIVIIAASSRRSEAVQCGRTRGQARPITHQHGLHLAGRKPHLDESHRAPDFVNDGKVSSRLRAEVRFALVMTKCEQRKSLPSLTPPEEASPEARIRDITTFLAHRSSLDVCHRGYY